MAEGWDLAKGAGLNNLGSYHRQCRGETHAAASCLTADIGLWGGGEGHGPSPGTYISFRGNMSENSNTGNKEIKGRSTGI